MLASCSKVFIGIIAMDHLLYLKMLTAVTEEMSKNGANNIIPYVQQYETYKQIGKTSMADLYEFNANFFQNHYNEMLSKHLKPNELAKITLSMRFLNQLFSPKNNPLTNEEVIKEFHRTNGMSFVNGFQNYLQDMKENAISSTDKSAFTVGKNLAITKGAVVFQNDLIQLIYYTPQTQTYATPLLIVPPWINKYYILDLQQHNSLVKWLVDNGYAVFLISWNNPDKELSHKTFEDYLMEGPLQATKAILKQTKQKKINIAGYCIGGTLVATFLSYLKEKNLDLIKSATFLTSLIDFSEPGDLGAFIDEEQISAIESITKQQGYLDGKLMSCVFSLLKPKEMIWNFIINNYFLGKSPKPFDILYWNADNTRLPHKMHNFYLRNMYLENNLAKPGYIKIDNTPIYVSQITIPTYFVATEKDDIVPWRSAYKSAKLFGSKSKHFILAGSGHVAGIINPPCNQKYGYSSFAIKKGMDCNGWSKKCKTQNGSWWGDWHSWLLKKSGKRVKSYNTVNSIEPAPGKYVKKT